jgi:hypothetical protein
MDIESFTMRGLPNTAMDAGRCEEMGDYTNPDVPMVKARLFSWVDMSHKLWTRRLGWFTFDQTAKEWRYICEEI